MRDKHATTVPADDIRWLLQQVLGTQLPLRVCDWEGNVRGTGDAPMVIFRRRRALTRMLYAPGEMGLARAFVTGDLDFEGDLAQLLNLLAGEISDLGQALPRATRRTLVRRALRLHALRWPPRRPALELRRPRRRLHSLRSDRRAISHHYDVGNDFYRLFLGNTMAYSCAYWRTEDSGLDSAQRDKFALICAKLDLREGQRLLDIGCGWGGLLIHAAQHHGIHGVGITLSREQQAYATEAARLAGVGDRLEFRLQDYREVVDGPFDAIASVGMAEHVGSQNMATYASQLARLLAPGGRLLNHAIASVAPPPKDKHSLLRDGRTFIDRYVFPDGELLTLSDTLQALEGAGFEVRDVEGLREHYALTLRAWVGNLRHNWDEAVRATSDQRARIWWLYMAGSAAMFERGRITIFQTLAAKQRADGGSRLPLTRGALIGDLLN